MTPPKKIQMMMMMMVMRIHAKEIMEKMDIVNTAGAQMEKI
jgi:hypothetical protein